MSTVSLRMNMEKMYATVMQSLSVQSFAVLISTATALQELR